MHVVLFGAFKSVIQAANELGVRLTVIDLPSNMPESCDFGVHDYFLFNYHDRELTYDIVKRVHRKNHVDMILSFTEPALILASELAEYLNVKTSVPLEIVNNTKNKSRMRHILSKSNHSLSSAIVKNKQDVFDFLLRFPVCIVKPVDGVASQFVFKICQTNLHLIDDINFNDREYICEEFIEGEEYSVECFSFNGDHKVISIHKKFKAGDNAINPFVEIGHIGPANISDDERHSLIAATYECLDLLGVTNGPSHTELIISKNGVKIIETHTRVGGDRIFHLMKLTTGIDVFKLSLDWLCFGRSYFDKVQEKGSAAIYFFCAKKGVISHMSDISYFSENKEVVEFKMYKKIGDHVNDLLGSGDRIGHVIFYRDDGVITFGEIEKVIGNFNIVVEC